MFYSKKRRGVQHASFSRVFETKGVPFGHVSGNLISNRVGDLLEEHATKAKIYDPDLWQPLDEQALSRGNRSDGSTLLVTSFLWNRCGNLRDDVTFSGKALEHLVKWFEGNRINSVVFTVEDKSWSLVSDVVLSIAWGNRRSVRLAENFRLFRIKAPWNPRTATAALWPKRIFAAYERPERDLHKHLKLKGRVFREFDFDLERALNSGCIGGSYNAPKAGKPEIRESPSFDDWRSQAAFSLGLKNAEDPIQKRVLDKVIKVVSKNPSLLAL